MPMAALPGKRTVAAAFPHELSLRWRNRGMMAGRTGVAAMPDYQLYCLDGDGHIGLADWIEADTDEEAVKKARELRPDAHRCEIWLKSKLVANLNHQGQFDRP
jgi:hypothetical protein